MTKLDARFAQRAAESQSLSNSNLCKMVRWSAQRIRDLQTGHLAGLTQADKDTALAHLADDIDFLGALLRERIRELRDKADVFPGEDDDETPAEGFPKEI